MFKTVGDQVWAFDCEWIPDPTSAKLLLDTDPGASDLEAMEALWAKGGATAEDPRPFLRTAQCRVVSIAMMQRFQRGNEVKLNLLWLPRDVNDPAKSSETAIVGTFLNSIGKFHPQLVGFNSRAADIRILLQRAFVKGISSPEFCKRPDKPWEGIDYFARDNECHVDLMEILGGFGSKSISLNEAARLSGIPGKIGTCGDDVAQMWLDGQWREIVQYNCFDAITTYLVWLRVAHLAGHFNAEEYELEQDRVHELLETLCDTPEMQFLGKYIEEWDRLGSLKDELN